MNKIQRIKLTDHQRFIYLDNKLIDLKKIVAITNPSFSIYSTSMDHLGTFPPGTRYIITFSIYFGDSHPIYFARAFTMDEVVAKKDYPEILDPAWKESEMVACINEKIFIDKQLFPLWKAVA